MKIVLTGGGSGGHFYPLIAVAESLQKQLEQAKNVEGDVELKFYYFGPTAYDQAVLDTAGISYTKVSAGKLRRYFSVKNFTDIFKTGWGFLVSFWRLFVLYPDAVFSKGGYASAPTVFAAKLLGIPIMLHESDSVPGKTNRWFGKMAKRIALSFEEAGEHFEADKIMYTGQPVRHDIKNTRAKQITADDQEHTLLILGGSQGAQAINDLILRSLVDLLPRIKIIHQAGEKNVEEVKTVATEIATEHNLDISRYTVKGFFTTEELSEAVQNSTIALSRSGSGIFELACWGMPSILIPLPTSASDHQRKNAYAFQKRGAAIVIEQANMTPTILTQNIEHLMTNQADYQALRKNISERCTIDAADKIAKELIELSINHA